MSGSWALYRRWVQDLTYKGVGPPNKISSWASWSVKERPVLHSSFFFFVFVFVFVFVLFFRTIFNSKSQCIKICFLKEPGPSTCTCTEWILSFVQEMGVRPDLQRGWSTQQNLFLSFLIYEAKTGPTLSFFFHAIFNSKSQCIKICF